MSDAYVIEVRGQTVGLIVRDAETETDGKYRFLASLYAVIDLEGEYFSSPWEAERAARNVLSKSRHARPEKQAYQFPTAA